MICNYIVSLYHPHLLSLLTLKNGLRCYSSVSVKIEMVSCFSQTLENYLAIMSYCPVHRVSSTKEGTVCMICVLQLFHFLLCSVENPVIVFVKGIRQSVGSQSIYQQTRGNSWCSADITHVTRGTTTDLNRHR